VTAAGTGSGGRGGAADAGAADSHSRGANSLDASELVAMGVVHPHGLKGELKVVLYNAGSDVDWRGLEVTLRSRKPEAPSVKRTRVEAFRRSGPLALLRLAGIADRDGAEAVNGLEVAIERASLPEPAEDEVYLGDLVGLRVREGESDVGVVREIRVYPAASCVLVALTTGGELEVPVHAPYVVEVDLRERTLRVAHLADLADAPADAPADEPADDPAGGAS